MNNPNIVIINRNQSEAQFLALQLQTQGYRSRVAAGFSGGWNLLIDDLPDLVLCSGLDQEALEFCRQVRRYSDLPLLVIGETGRKNLELAFLEAGADDYLVRPFSTQLLTVKIKVILRRRQPSESSSRILSLSPSALSWS